MNDKIKELRARETKEHIEELQAEREERREEAGIEDDYVTAEDREAARVEAALEQELTPAELKAAAENGQTATEYARSNLGVGAVIEAQKQDDWASQGMKTQRITAALPDDSTRRGNPVARGALTPDETAAAKRAEITAEQLIEREYGIDASLHDEISLKEAISEQRRGGRR